MKTSRRRGGQNRWKYICFQHIQPYLVGYPQAMDKGERNVPKSQQASEMSAITWKETRLVVIYNNLLQK